jgi:hypothetical protein
MLLAAILFLIGWLLGRSYTMLILIVTSAIILLTALVAFARNQSLDLVHLLMIGGYLAAHQAGYLVGAYCSGHEQSN